MQQTKISLSISMLLITASLTTSSAHAIAGLSANATVSNNYLWRGVTQTNNAAAISGGIDYQHSSGFAVGTWASNADWAQNMSYELDVYASYSNSLDNGLGYNLGYIYYAYDSDAESDFSELNLSLSYDAYSISYHTLVSSDADGSFGDDSYLSADAAFDIAPELTLAFHLGYYDFDAGGDYRDYGVSLSKGGFSFGLFDTDLDGADGELNVVISYSTNIDL
ncbi:conserved hypothetical protein [Colwellia chukchiensis]|uniref:Uncharacterized protein n=1 Tax=Colwellia chukchiensis TaxID=641665 RepID=A0A1H7SYL4_9GAMM|nr:TorF family putative porin [Colwellia chukchiensis]SEL77136.1 conserved hypothetical protein [Colwellia chukchiensis]